jgi:hypothetical protein
MVRLGSQHQGERQMAQGKTATKTNGKNRASARTMKKSASRSGDKLAAAEEEVTIDRRRGARRDEKDVAAVEGAAPQLERRKKVNRRRQIDPTTCERDYTELEVEFMNALDDYKRKSGRMFPTCSEVLEVIHSLGYVKPSAAEMNAIQASNQPIASAKPMPEDWSGSMMLPVEAQVECGMNAPANSH